MNPVPAPASTPTDGWTALRRATVAGGVLLVTLNAFEAIAVATAMPTVAAKLGALAGYPVAFAIPMAASVIAMVCAGTWADVRGPRVVLLTGVTLFVGGLLLAGAAPSMPVLIVGRTIQSLGSGLDMVALYVIIAAMFPESLRPKVFVWTSAAWVGPSLFGPPLAGLLVTQVSWRWVFFVAAVFAVPAAALLVPVLRRLPGIDGHRHAGAGFTRRAGAAVAAATGACLLSLAAHWSAVLGIGLLVVGIALLVRSAPKLVPAGTYRLRRGIGSVIMSRALLGAAFSGTDVYLPLMLTGQHGMSPTAAGLALTSGALSWSAAAWVSGRIRTDDGRRRSIRIGFGALTVGIAVCLIAAIPAIPAIVVYLGWFVAGCGMGLAYSPLTVLVMGMSADSEQGRNSSALQTNETLTSSVLLAISAVLFGYLVSVSPTGAFAVGIALALLFALLGSVSANRLQPNAGEGGAVGDAGNRPAPEDLLAR